METDNQKTLISTASGLKKGAKGAAKIGVKAVKKGGKLIKGTISGLSGLLGINITPIIAVVMVVVILLSAVAGFLKNLMLNRNYIKVEITPEGKEIVSLFKVYTDDLYLFWYQGIDNDFARPTDYRYGAEWENTNAHKGVGSQIHDDDDERDKYKKIMSFIEANDYEFYLCGLWKALTTGFVTYVSENLTYPPDKQDNETYEDTQITALRNVQNLLPTASAQSPKNAIDDNDIFRLTYYYWLQHYLVFDKSTGNDLFGFNDWQCSYCTKNGHLIDYESDDLYWDHPFFVKEAFKACLGAFTDDKGNINVPTIDELNSQILSQSNSSPSSAVNSTDASEAAVSPKKELSENITAEQYAEALNKKTKANFIRELKSRFCPLPGVNAWESVPLSQIKDAEINYYYAMECAFYYSNGVSPYGDQDEEKFLNFTKNLNVEKSVNDYINNAVREKSTAFLTYSLHASGTAANVLTVAKNEIGRKGQKYCDAINGGVYTQWCSIYVKWLLLTAGGISVDTDYGWDANVGVWCDNLKSKGLFHIRGDPNDNYTPKPGDIVIFSWGSRGDGSPSRDHVGIVFEIDGDVIVTNEGNTTDPKTGETSCVAEHRNGPGGDRPITSIYGYGDVTYFIADNFGSAAFVPRLTAPERGSRYYDSSENPFKPGAGIFENNGNCTAYAWGRAFEILGNTPDIELANACDFYPNNKAKYDANHQRGYPYGSKPKLGAIMCLSGGGSGFGHVAVVEQINSDGSIVTSESGWKSYIFRTYTRSSNDGYTLGDSRYKLMGFIYVYQEESTNIQFTAVKGWSTEESKVYAFFKARGLNNAAIAAIMANIAMESAYQPYYYFADYVPDAEGAPGNSGGICMWYDDNCDRFKRDCPNWKTSVDAQIVYLYHTLKENDQGVLPPSQKYSYGCSGMWTYLTTKVSNTEAGARQAAYYFCRNYENPSPGSEGTRQNFAGAYFKKMSTF